MRIYITRHGTTQWNKDKRLQGWKDSKLTLEGKNNAIKLGQSLSHIDFDLIYSSPQKRALDTARLIQGSRDIKIVSHEGLREMGYGTWDGMTLKDISQSYPEEYFNYIHRPSKYVPIDGESFQSLFKRLEDFLQEIKHQEAKNILLVTHGIPLKAIITKVRSLTMEDFAKLPIFIGTSLSIIQYKNNKFELVIEDDRSHLQKNEP